MSPDAAQPSYALAGTGVHAAHTLHPNLSAPELVASADDALIALDGDRETLDHPRAVGG